jgi:hypothetical protein
MHRIAEKLRAEYVAQIGHKPGGAEFNAWQNSLTALALLTRLAAGIAPSTYWASDPNGISQIGCVHTARGFEFDYVGVIFGLDLSRHQRLDRRAERVTRLDRQAVRRPLHRPRQAHLPRPPHPRSQGLLRLRSGPNDRRADLRFCV